LHNELNDIDRDNAIALGKLRADYVELVKDFRKKFVSPVLPRRRCTKRYLPSKAVGIGTSAPGLRGGTISRDRFAAEHLRLAGYPAPARPRWRSTRVGMAKLARRSGTTARVKAEETFEVLAGHVQRTAELAKGDYVEAYAKIQGTGMRFFDPQGYMPWDAHLEQICDTVRKEQMDAVFIDNLGFLTRAAKNTFEVENVASARIKDWRKNLRYRLCYYTTFGNGVGQHRA